MCDHLKGEGVLEGVCYHCKGRGVIYIRHDLEGGTWSQSM